ncbi:MAG: hypothetical protein U9Q38_04910 [Thermodesulfobacteriota bacterium]|nr:hypothetical protein [Thermodesulfobacteriota bacterium]
MKRHKHLYEQVCSFENLHAAAYAALRGKRGKKPAAAFFADLEEELVALRTELLSGTYQHGGYHYFQIHEPKERRVAAAPFRDRVVHHAIVRVVEPLTAALSRGDGMAVMRVTVMMLTSVLSMFFFVKSFRDVRRARKLVARS